MAELNNEALPLEVLFEFSGSRKVLTVTSLTSLCEKVEGELLKFGVFGTVSPLSQVKQEGGQAFFLQRYDAKWETFVNVDNIDQVIQGDKVTVVSKPCNKRAKDSPPGRIISKVGKPSGTHAKSSSNVYTPKATSTPPFDPDCVIISEKKSGKINNRPVSINVVMLTKFSSVLPKGKCRRRLASRGQIQTMRITREMSHVEIRTKILKAFKVSQYTVLESDGTGNGLLKAAEQDVDGLYVVGRRGCLYLCESFEDPCSEVPSKRSSKQECSSSSDESTSRELSTSAARVYKQGKALSASRKAAGEHLRPNTSTSGVGMTFGDTEPSTSTPNLESDIEIPRKRKRLSLSRKRSRVISLDSSSTDDSLNQTSEDYSRETHNRTPESTVESVGSLNQSQSTRDNYIIESREIRAEQDREFEESLRIDEAKSAKTALRQRLRNKWPKEHLNENDSGEKFWVRFPNSTKLYCSIPREASVKVLYEICFAYGPMMGCFSIHTMLPRSLLSCTSTVANVGFSSAVLVVEDDVNGFDPMDCLTDESESAASASSADSPVNILVEVDAARQIYMMDSLDTHHGSPRSVGRGNLYSDVMEMYETSSSEILKEFPFRIRYQGEKAIDTGGVCRDMFSVFWDEAYLKTFDGERLLVPSLNPKIKLEVFKVLGTILSHGYMSCGYLPVRIAFPIIAAVLRGPDVTIPEDILIETFIDFISTYDSSSIRDAVKQSSITLDMETTLISILSRYGCTEMPTAKNLRRLLSTVAQHTFLGKPLGVLYKLRAGVAIPYQEFWANYSIEKLFRLYKSLNATAASVLALVDEPKEMNAAEKRIFNYLLTFICNMKNDELRTLLRYVTGSSVLLAQQITVTFNHITGLARRPISHTCGCLLELSLAYDTYPEFEHEFKTILSSEYAWIMDGL